MVQLTVIMPVYNGEKYLKEAIDSILNQTFTDFKLLVLNDNSTDGTKHILKKYQNQDHRIEVINKTQNIGPALLRNEGIAYAKTEFIALQDADDISMPTRFEKQIKVLRNNTKIGLCGTWFTIFGDKKEKTIRHNENHDALKVQFLNSCGIGNSTVMFRKNILGNLKFEAEFVPAEDYALWSKLIQVTEFYNIPESLLNYRWHPNNISQSKEKNLRKSEVAIKKRQLKHFGINENDTHINDYLNALTLKRKLSTKDAISAIKASKKLKLKNNANHYYDAKLFNNLINKTIIRTIRNSKDIDANFMKYLKHESGYYHQISVVDKLMLFFKSLL